MKKRTFLTALTLAAVVAAATACGSKSGATASSAADTTVTSQAADASSAASGASSEAASKDAASSASKDSSADSSASKESAKADADSSASSGKSDEAEATMTGTISEIKDFMFTLTTDDGTAYAFSFDQDKAPEGLSDVADGDKVTVTYTGTVDTVDAFTGIIVSVKKAD